MHNLLKLFFLLSLISNTLQNTNIQTQPHHQLQNHQQHNNQQKVIHETIIQNADNNENNKKDKVFKYYVFEEKCYEMFFEKSEFMDVTCIRLTISKFIGYGLVYGSLVVKTPQIAKILMNCNVLGISFSSIVVEAIMYFMMMGYNIHKGYPFSIYGENVFLGTSNIFIIAFFFIFCKDKNYRKYIKGSLFLIAICCPLIFQLAPTFIIQNSLWLGMIAFMISRYQQIKQNSKNKSTGNLSLLTTFLNFGGNIARSFTIITQASGDVLYLLSNLIPVFINGFILIQFVLYWNNKMNYEAVIEISRDQKSLTETEIRVKNIIV